MAYIIDDLYYFLTLFILQVRRHLDGSNAALVLLHRPQRVYSTKQKVQCEADSGPPKSNKLFWGLVGATVFTGAAVVYAK